MILETPKLLGEDQIKDLDPAIVPPWKNGTLLRVKPNQWGRSGILAFDPFGPTKEARSKIVGVGNVIMFIGIVSYGTATTPVLMFLFGEKSFLVKIHKNTTYELLEEVENDKT